MKPMKTMNDASKLKKKNKQGSSMNIKKINDLQTW